MEKDWPISLPFELPNLEDAQFRIHDENEQVHREDLTGWEKNNQSGVKGRFVEIIHGYKIKGEGTPCTLIVFEWLLVPGKRCNRLKNVKIDVGFRAIGNRDGVPLGGSLSAWDPVPIKWLPFEPVLSQFSTVPYSEKSSKELGLQAGYAPYISVAPKGTTETTLAVERIDYRYITGSKTYCGKNSGGSNGIEWKFEENVSLESGVQYLVRTAVLLQRKPHDFGKFAVTIESQANSSHLKRNFDSFLKATGLRPSDGPAAFDPTVEPSVSEDVNDSGDIAARPTTRDWKNLGQVDLKDVLIKDEDLRELVKQGQKEEPPKAQVVELRITTEGGSVVAKE